MNCLNCQSNQTSPYLKKGQYQYLKCADCGLIFLSACPSKEEMEKFYGPEYFGIGSKEFSYVDYDADKAVLDSFYKKYLLKLKKFLNKDNIKLLDIGSATGYFSKLAQKQGMDAEGLEISDKLVGMSKEKGIKSHIGSLGSLPQEFLTENKFDAITLWDVVEHLCDTKKSFEEIDLLLKSGGVLLLNTPNSGSRWAKIFKTKWHTFVPPEHVVIFSKENLTQFLQKHGYEIELVETTYKKFTLSYLFNTLAYCYKSRILSYVAKFLIKVKFLGKIKLFLPLGDNMLLIARKK